MECYKFLPIKSDVTFRMFFADEKNVPPQKFGLVDKPVTLRTVR
jgi:hypothetical protein